MTIANAIDWANFFDSNTYQNLRDNHRAQQLKDESRTPVAHLSLLGTPHQWLLTELDEDGIAFGLADLGMGCPELGYICLNEIQDAVDNIRKDNPLSPLKLQYRAMNTKYTIDVYAQHARQNQEIVLLDEISSADNESESLSLTDFIKDFKSDLLTCVNKQLPALYDSNSNNQTWLAALSTLKRQPLGGQRDKILAVLEGLMTANKEAVILNGEMGTGKTFMSIACSHVYFNQGHKKPILVMSPPHLVYKWRREILETVDNAKVTVINGSDAINRLIKLRAQENNTDQPHYIVIGRVRMRMGFHWKLAYSTRSVLKRSDNSAVKSRDTYVTCSHCATAVTDSDNNLLTPSEFERQFADKRVSCKHCHSPLWSMKHRNEDLTSSAEKKLRTFFKQLPGIGKVTADRLIATYGVDTLNQIIDDNVYDFVNLCTADGEFFFTDKQATRLERSLGKLEFALRTISYQPSEFIKRYFPRKYFGLAIIDEAHEYKNQSSAQGQAMGVLCQSSDKCLALTGTLMGGYASDLFHLFWRLMPSTMIDAGYRANANNSLTSAEMQFMKRYGILEEVRKVSRRNAYKTSKANAVTVNTTKKPGFSPVGIAQFVLPNTVFMRLTDLGADALPSYSEYTRTVALPEEAQSHYQSMKNQLRGLMKEALRQGDNSLVGLVMQFLLRWPDTAFRSETIMHPRTRDELMYAHQQFNEDELTPKEADCIELCLEQKARNRRTIVYTTYSGKHDTMTRLKERLQEAGLKVAVLRSSVATDAREDWIADKVEQGVDVLITNPELVKTGLDLLDFPTLYFMQTGVNTYTLEQASRRSWRIGQEQAVEVYFACFEKTAQAQCLSLMSSKIKVSKSTSGVMPDTGLDVFEEDDNSIIFELAKELVNA